FIRTKRGAVESSCRTVRKSTGTSFSNENILPFGDRPKEGGSRIIASYLLLRRTSRWANASASSVIHLMGARIRWLASWFWCAQIIVGFEASTCVTSAPSEAAYSVAPPV